MAYKLQSFVKGHIRRYALFIFETLFMPGRTDRESIVSQISRRRLIAGGRFRESAAILIAFILLALFMFEPFALAAEKDSSAPAQSGNPAVSAITQAAVKAGALSCASRINQVTNFLTAGSRSGAILFEPPSDPDKRLVSISLGLAMKGGKIAYASESFAPNQANGCGGIYETVVYWEAGCADVAKNQFSVFKNYGVLVNSIIVLDGGAGVRVFLMPAGTGCVAIKKEVLN